MNLKKENQKSPELSIHDFIRIQEIFNQKNWPIEEGFDDHVFENFCNMLACLEIEQRELVINLTEKFLWVQEHTYTKHFSVAFDTFIKSHDFSRGKKIYICPLLPEEDFEKSKSSIFLLYFVKASLRAIQSKYPDFAIFIRHFLAHSTRFSKSRNANTALLSGSKKATPAFSGIGL